MNPGEPSPATVAALRAGAAAAFCLVLAEMLHLSQPALAVWTTHMVMVQYTFTTFQKGVERLLGRGVGILLAICIATLTRNSLTVGVLLEFIAIVPLFYVFFAGRMSYTFLNAGLYLATMMQLARTHPGAVTATGGELFTALMLGVGVAILVSWVTRVEQDLSIHTEGEKLWPIDHGRLMHSLMLAMTVGVVHLLTHALQLSPIDSMVSVLMLTITPDYQSLLNKGKLRLAGAGLAMAFAAITLVLLVRRPSFVLLVLALFLGIFLAAMLARTSVKWSYAGVQMGLVLPMILVVPLPELGSLEKVFTRIGGVLVAIVASTLVGLVWGLIAPTSPLPSVPVALKPPQASPS